MSGAGRTTTKTNLGNGHRFRGKFLTLFAQNPTGWASIGGVQKRRRTEESSAETPDTKQIHLDGTDLGLGIKEREATRPSCPKPHEPKNRRRVIVKIILRWNEKERIIRALLDWGTSIPVLSKQRAIKNQVNTFQRQKRLMIENFAGSTLADIGLTDSYPLRLQHRKHCSVEWFEITPTDSECDMILRFW
jgi:hypothetical protein